MNIKNDGIDQIDLKRILIILNRFEPFYYISIVIIGLVGNSVSLFLFSTKKFRYEVLN